MARFWKHYGLRLWVRVANPLFRFSKNRGDCLRSPFGAGVHRPIKRPEDIVTSYPAAEELGGIYQIGTGTTSPATASELGVAWE